MLDLQYDTVLTALLLVVLVLLVGTAMRGRGVPERGRYFIHAGFGLLVLGNLLYFADRLLPSTAAAVISDAHFRTWIQQFACLRGGLVLLAIGVLRIVPDVVAIERSKRMVSSAVESDTKLQFVRGLLDSIVKSSIGGTVVLQAIRDETGSIVDFEFVLVNPAAEHILGRAAAGLIDKRLRGQFPCIEKHGMFDDAVGAMESGIPFTGERECPDERGGRWYELAAVRHGDCLAVTVVDITQQRRIEQQLRHSAQHDALTGLPNRALLQKRVTQALSRSKHDDKYRFAVLFLDFDRFKLINDSLGHEVGDQLLMSIAERLRANLRAIDAVSSGAVGHFSARLGGDEFVVFLDDLHEVCNADIIAQRLLKDLAAPHRIAGHEITSTASIGIVTNERGYSSADDILRDADTAMYEAKKAGKACAVSFSDDMHESAMTKLEIETDLRDAIGRGAMFLEYQPIVSLKSGRIVGAEALIRWPHPERGVIPPTKFVGVAEELGIASSMGELVLRQAALALGGWQERLMDGKKLTTNVNISRTELAHPNLVVLVREMLEETGIDPSTLGLEITETVVMDDIDRVIPILKSLKDLGVKLVMDDFGTGHSSLSCLDRVPFDVLKIDRSFVNSARNKRQYAAIIDAIVVLSHNLDMPVVGEGIETEDHLTLLQALDCDYGQGWLFGEPMSADSFQRLLAEDGAKTAAPTRAAA